MAVIAVGGPDFRIHQGNVDPRYPIGSWTAQVTATGDLSGGTVTTQILFRGAALSPLPLGFSLEVLTAERVDAAAQDVEVIVSGFSRAGNDGINNAMVLILNALQGATRSPTQPWPANEIFLGAPIRGDEAEMTLTWPTNTTGISYIARAFGQMWLAEAMFELAGPQTQQSGIPAISGPSRPHGSLQEVRSQRVTVPARVAVAGVAIGPPPVEVVVPPLVPGKRVVARVLESGVPVGPGVGVTMGPREIGTVGPSSLTRAQRATRNANARIGRALAGKSGTLRRDRADTVRRTGDTTATAIAKAQRASRSVRGKALLSASAFFTTARSAIFED